MTNRKEVELAVGVVAEFTGRVVDGDDRTRGESGRNPESNHGPRGINDSVYRDGVAVNVGASINRFEGFVDIGRFQRGIVNAEDGHGAIEVRVVNPARSGGGGVDETAVVGALVVSEARGVSTVPIGVITARGFANKDPVDIERDSALRPDHAGHLEEFRSRCQTAENVERISLQVVADRALVPCKTIEFASGFEHSVVDDQPESGSTSGLEDGGDLRKISCAELQPRFKGRTSLVDACAEDAADTCARVGGLGVHRAVPFKSGGDLTPLEFKVTPLPRVQLARAFFEEPTVGQRSSVAP